MLQWRDHARSGLVRKQRTRRVLAAALAAAARPAAVSVAPVTTSQSDLVRLRGSSRCR